MRLRRVVLPKGLGSRDAATSAGSGISKTAKGYAELQMALISGRDSQAKSLVWTWHSVGMQRGDPQADGACPGLARVERLFGLSGGKDEKNWRPLEFLGWSPGGILSLRR